MLLGHAFQPAFFSTCSNVSQEIPVLQETKQNSRLLFATVSQKAMITYGLIYELPLMDPKTGTPISLQLPILLLNKYPGRVPTVMGPLACYRWTSWHWCLPVILPFFPFPPCTSPSSKKWKQVPTPTSAVHLFLHTSYLGFLFVHNMHHGMSRLHITAA